MTRICKLISVVGTRPEAIKMAPVIKLLQGQKEVEHLVLCTSQHKEMLRQALGMFGIAPGVDLNLMETNQTLAGLTSRAIASLSTAFSDLRPDCILIQGDTTTVMSAALAAFYLNIPVGHVEAGLRSHDRANPFPEELNRQITGYLATMHFAPTQGARQNLLAEGVHEESIFVTGNTIVDALQSIDLSGRFDHRDLEAVDFKNNRVILVTAHRRENHGKPLQSICEALREIVKKFADVRVVYPVHPNPNVQTTVMALLGSVESIHLVPPLSYSDLLRTLSRCYFALTDSGGIQEEAPSFQKPVLVLRKVTERPEVIVAGAGKIVGTSYDTVVGEVNRLLTDNDLYQRMSNVKNPFGDGTAAQKIVATLLARFC